MTTLLLQEGMDVIANVDYSNFSSLFLFRDPDCVVQMDNVINCDDESKPYCNEGKCSDTLPEIQGDAHRFPAPVFFTIPGPGLSPIPVPTNREQC